MHKYIQVTSNSSRCLPCMIQADDKEIFFIRESKLWLCHAVGDPQVNELQIGAQRLERTLDLRKTKKFWIRKLEYELPIQRLCWYMQWKYQTLCAFNIIMPYKHPKGITRSNVSNKGSQNRTASSLVLKEKWNRSSANPRKIMFLQKIWGPDQRSSNWALCFPRFRISAVSSLQMLSYFSCLVLDAIHSPKGKPLLFGGDRANWLQKHTVCKHLPCV